MLHDLGGGGGRGVSRCVDTGDVDGMLQAKDEMSERACFGLQKKYGRLWQRSDGNIEKTGKGGGVGGSKCDTNERSFAS